MKKNFNLLSAAIFIIISLLFIFDSYTSLNEIKYREYSGPECSEKFIIQIQDSVYFLYSESLWNIHYFFDNAFDDYYLSTQEAEIYINTELTEPYWDALDPNLKNKLLWGYIKIYGFHIFLPFFLLYLSVHHISARNKKRVILLSSAITILVISSMILSMNNNSFLSFTTYLTLIFLTNLTVFLYYRRKKHMWLILLPFILIVLFIEWLTIVSTFLIVLSFLQKLLYLFFAIIYTVWDNQEQKHESMLTFLFILSVIVLWVVLWGGPILIPSISLCQF
ncbi:hypothetical protein COB57_06270 [Candidatus Peregrinibacteria bacterium]|nr:MAG: hypothetical protein COB57_06270 [Candidatus Peregrinibacteria bacterium]